MRAGELSAIGYGQYYRAEDLPFEIGIIDDRVDSASPLLADAAAILASGDNHLDFHFVDAAAVPVVFVIEYTLATRLKINQLARQDRVKRFKSAAWTVLTERKRRRAFRKAAGLQCNGAPAFDAYRGFVADALLYYDTRTRDAAQIGASALAAKQHAIREGAPLRLAFSGRLERLKGADHLIPVARAPVSKGVAFRLDIYGDGSLRREMDEEIARHGLGGIVTMRGPVPFETELVPGMIERTDLFLCCHRQADPSCTYLETLSCGVPIVGYDNAAFRGVLGLGDVGIPVRMDDINGVANAVTALAADRERLEILAANAARAGAAHGFEKTFDARIAHLRRIAGM